MMNPIQLRRCELEVQIALEILAGLYQLVLEVDACWVRILWGRANARRAGEWRRDTMARWPFWLGVVYGRRMWRSIVCHS